MSERLLHAAARGGAALSLALLPAAMAESAHASTTTEQSTADQCDPVYLEAGGSVDPELANAMLAVGSLGINAHVQILVGVEDRGRTLATIQEQSRILNATCDWPEGERGKFTVTLALRTKQEIVDRIKAGEPNSDSPALLSVGYSGSMNQSMSAGERATALKSAGATLRQKVGPQQTIANLINSIIDDGGLEDEPFDPTILLAGVGGMVTLAAISGLGFTVYKTRGNNTIISDIKAASISNIDAALAKVGPARSGALSAKLRQVSLDDPEMAKIAKEGFDIAGAVTRLSSLRTELETLKGSMFLPKIADSQDLASKTTEAIVALERELAEYVAIIQTSEVGLDTLADNLQDATDLMAGIDAETSKLKADGWTVAGLSEKNGTLATELEVIKQDDENQFDLKASTEIQPLLVQLIERRNHIVGLADKQAGLVDEHAKRETAIAAMTTVADESQELLSSLPYAASDLASVSGTPNQFASLLKQLRTIQLTSAGHTTVKSPDAVAAAEKAATNFVAVAEQVQSLVAAIKNEQTTLEQLHIETTEGLTRLASVYDSSKVEIASWGTDVDSGTIGALTAFADNLDELQAAISVEKPALRVLLRKRKIADADMRGLIASASRQHQEMDQNRQSLAVTHEKMATELDALRSYVREHSGDISDISLPASISELDTGGAKLEVESRLIHYDKQLRSIRAAMRSAEKQHQDAVNERARERQRADDLRREQELRDQRVRISAAAGRRVLENKAAAKLANSDGETGNSSDTGGNV